MVRTGFTLVFAVLFTGALSFADGPLVHSSETDRLTGWRTLFDGSTTHDWRGFRKETFPENGWSVEDGWLHVEAGGGGGDIVSVDQFRNFELTLEWKAAPNGNSGIMYLTGESEGAPWMTAPEYQIFADATPHKDESTSAGGLYALYSPKGKTLNPAGEVNHARIVVVSNRIEHYVNGVLVLSAVRGSEDWNRRVAASKFASMPKFGTLDRGHICLQDHGDDVWFRNVRIREIPEWEAEVEKQDFKDLYNGRDLSGWTSYLSGDGAKMEDVWRVEDGILICRGTPAGYIRTKEDFTNFHLVVEWRWNPVTRKTGNSGVLFRQVGPDKVWPRSIEAQLMAGSAGDFWNIGEFPMKADPARTRGRNTKHVRANEFPAGAWNRYDILARGGVVELRVNGELLNRATSCWETAGKICLQSEGTEIQFRRVRISEFPSAVKN